MEHYENITSVMESLKSSGLRWLGATLGVVVYLAVVVYAEVHGFTLLSKTIDPGLLPLAVLGILALGFTAIALPLVIHHGSEPGKHRTAAIVFYAIDLAAMGANSILDAMHHTGSVDSQFLALWGIYAVPAMPLIVGAGWSLLWMLDPSQRERDMRAQIRAAARVSLFNAMKKAAGDQDVTAMVNKAAADFARQEVADTLGTSRFALPAPTQQPKEPAKSDNGHKPEVVTLNAEGEPIAEPVPARARKSHPKGE